MSQQQPPQGWGPGPQGYPPQSAVAQPLAPKLSWYHQVWAIALSLLFCFPVGLFFLWGSPRPSRGAKIGATVAIGLLLLIGMNGKKNARPDAVNGGAAFPAGAAPAALKAADPGAALVTESCLALSKQFGTSSKLSDLQKDGRWKQYSGRPFSWALQITEVSAGTFGGFHVQAKCAPESPSLIQDIQLSYDSDAKSSVLQLEKGSTYTLKGVLTSTSTLFGLGADGTL